MNSKIQVQLGQTATVNLALVLGEAREVVEVTSGTALLQTEDANITANVSNREIANVPNPGGDLTYIAVLTSGTTGNTSSGGGFGNFRAFPLRNYFVSGNPGKASYEYECS